MKKASKHATLLSDRGRELRTELARKIASFMGSEENRATDIPGLTLHRRIAPTAPCSMTYEPGVTVIAQGRKRVDLCQQSRSARSRDQDDRRRHVGEDGQQRG